MCERFRVQNRENRQGEDSWGVKGHLEGTFWKSSPCKLPKKRIEKSEEKLIKPKKKQRKTAFTYFSLAFLCFEPCCCFQCIHTVISFSFALRSLKRMRGFLGMSISSTHRPSSSFICSINEKHSEQLCLKQLEKQRQN